MFRLILICAVVGVAVPARAQDSGPAGLATLNEPAWIGESRRMAEDIVRRRLFVGAADIANLEAKAREAGARGDLDPARFLALYFTTSSRPEKAREWTGFLEKEAKRTGSSADLALSEIFRAWSPSFEGRYEEAVQALVPLVEDAKDPLVVGIGAQLVAYGLADSGRPTSALKYAHRGLTAMRRDPSRRWIVGGLHDAWRYAVKDLRDFETAAAQTRASFEAAESEPYPVDGVTFVYNLAQTASDAGFHAAAKELVLRENALAAMTNLASEKFFASNLCAKVSFNAGDYAAALDCARKALSAVDAPREYVPPLRAVEVAALARLGRGGDARRALDALKIDAADWQDAALNRQIDQYAAEVQYAEGDASKAFAMLLDHHSKSERNDAEQFNAGAAELRASLEADLLAAEDRAAAKAREADLVERRAAMQRRLLFVVCAFACVAAALLVVMRRSARRLAEARAAAESANRSKSEFLASMSHELRTPLNGVLGMAQVLYSDARDAAQREQVKTILDSGRTLTAILNDILDLSKIEAGKLEISAVDDDLLHALKRLVALFEPQAREKGVVLSLHVEPGVPGWLKFDPVRVRQCVANLLSNAVKFTEKGAVDVRVGAVADGSGHRISVVVSDTGVGMDAETLARLFSPFTQADATITRRFGGTGLGLTISRRLARLMGGDVAASSVRGEGTSMSFSFLAAPATEPPRVRSADDAEARRGAGAALKGKTVLVVDDIMVNRQVAALFLSPFGAKIAHAASGAEALAYLENHHCDAVLMDVQMPEMDGFETTRRIRALASPIAGVPIVALTAEAMEGDRERCLAAGMTDYAPKPLDARTLLAALSRAMAITQSAAA